MFKSLRYLEKKDWLSIFFIVGLVVVQVWLDLTMPDYTMKLTEAVSSGGVTMSDVWTNGGMMLLCAFGSMVSTFICGYLCARLSSSFSRRLRSEMNNKISSFSPNKDFAKRIRYVSSRCQFFVRRSKATTHNRKSHDKRRATSYS